MKLVQRISSSYYVYTSAYRALLYHKMLQQIMLQKYKLLSNFDDNCVWPQRFWPSGCECVPYGASGRLCNVVLKARSRDYRLYLKYLCLNFACVYQSVTVESKRCLVENLNENALNNWSHEGSFRSRQVKSQNFIHSLAKNQPVKNSVQLEVFFLNLLFLRWLVYFSF